MRAPAVTAVGIACALAVGAAAPAGQQATFRSGAEVVAVDVSVKVGDAPVPGLTAADFELTDNGVVQKIDAATVETLPIDVTLLLDLSKSVTGPMLTRLTTSVHEASELLHPVDRLRLIAIHESIDQVFGWEPGGTVPSLAGLTARGGTALFDGLAAAMIRPAEPERRQLIIALTDGGERLSILDRQTLGDIALRSDSVVDVVVPMPKITMSPEMGPLLDVVTRTGGQLFRILINDSLGEAFRRSVGDFRTSYVLRYAPQGVPKPGWHTLVVRVTRPGTFDVHARKGYPGG